MIEISLPPASDAPASWTGLRSSKQDLAPENLGQLRASRVEDGAEVLRANLAADGYLFLPQALERDRVIDARQVVCDRLASENFLAPDAPVLEGVLRPGSANPYFRPDFARDNPSLMQVLYAGPLLAIFRELFGEPVRHFDYTWFRAIGTGGGTAPHCDIVYMGRGSRRLLTAWTPLGDIPVTIGGLIVLEASHKKSKRLAEYLRQDVDTYCENGPNAEKIRAGKMNWEHYDGSFAEWNGALSNNPRALQDQLGGRWLTTDYRMGDVLIFTMGTIHASLDNPSDRIRLSTDTRYQPARDPIDERWVGENPIAHGVAGKRGKIC